MSIQVPIGELEAVAAGYGPSAYVLTATGDGPPRVTHSVARFEGTDEGTDIVVRLGRSGCRALAANPGVCVLWAATTDEPMSLIVDGTVVGVPDSDGGDVRIRVGAAVRHRPAPD